MTMQTLIAERVKHVPARRWMEYATLFGRDTQDCMTDAVTVMVIILNEHHRATFGSPSLDKYLDMGLVEMEAELTAAFGADEELSGEGAFFPAAGVAGGAGAGGVVADGLGARVRGDAGPDVPVDGDPTD